MLRLVWHKDNENQSFRLRKIGIMGGTFDPIHNGHLVAASEVMDAFDLEQVIFVPAYHQPFKPNDAYASSEHRYLMCELATASNSRFTVSRIDIDRKGITYTYDTLLDLSKEIQEVSWYFIAGADAISSILRWKNATDLFNLAHFVAVSRPGHDFGLPSELLTKKYPVSRIQVPAFGISSSECRRRIAEGRPIWYLVPDEVIRYITKYNLYRDN